MKKKLKIGRAEVLLAAILFLAFVYQVTLGIYANSITFDEPAFLAGGMNILRNSDYRFNSEAVVVPQIFEAFPAAVSKNISFPAIKDSVPYEQWSFAGVYIYASRNSHEFIIYSARFMVLLVGFFVGIVVYLWSRRLFGIRGALVSLFLFSFSPTILAHSGIAASDMITSFFFLISLFVVWHMMRKITLLSILAASIFLGLLFLSKHSAFFFVFVFVIMMTVRIFSENPLVVDIFKKRKVIQDKAFKFTCFICCGIVNAIVIFVMIWASYCFRYSMENPEYSRGNTEYFWQHIPDDSAVLRVVKFAADKHLLPEAYLYGFAYTYAQAKDRPAFMNGFYSNDGWWYFFPYAFLVKTTPGLLALLLASGIIFFKRRKLLYKIIPFLIFIAVYMFFSMTGKMNIGHRHILPIYPMLFILAAAVGTLIDFRSKRLVSILLMLSCAWTLFSAFSISPYYLAYFNFIAGGPPNAYKHLVDSSLDWGQGVSALKTYLEEDAPGGRNVYFSQFGSIPFRTVGLEAMDTLSYFPQPKSMILNFHGGLYCISATMYQLVYYPELAAWTPKMEALYENISAKLRGFLPLIDSQRLSKMLTDKKISDAFDVYSPYKYLAFGKIILYLHETKRKPDVMPGYSILVFDLSEDEVQRALSSPSVPIKRQ